MIAPEALGKREQLTVINSALDDDRRLIAAGKARRWEIVKLSFAINGAISFIGWTRNPNIPFWILLSAAIAVTLASLQLLEDCDNRIEGARLHADKLERWLRENIVDMQAITGPAQSGDQVELAWFRVAIVCSGIILMAMQVPSK